MGGGRVERSSPTTNFKYQSHGPHKMCERSLGLLSAHFHASTAFMEPKMTSSSAALGAAIPALTANFSLAI